MVICEQFTFSCDKETWQASEPHDTPEQQFFEVALKVTGDLTQEPPNMNTSSWAFLDLLFFLFGVSAGHCTLLLPASCPTIASLAEN